MKAKREKNWKLLYLRSRKLARAKQLGSEYPRRPGIEGSGDDLPEAEEDPEPSS